MTLHFSTFVKKVTLTILAHEASKVHFSTDVSSNTEINVVCKDNDTIDVHVGFLQEGHIYEIQFAIPNRFPDGWKHPDLLDTDLQILSVDSVGRHFIFNYYDDLF